MKPFCIRVFCSTVARVGRVSDVNQSKGRSLPTNSNCMHSCCPILVRGLGDGTDAQCEVLSIY